MAGPSRSTLLTQTHKILKRHYKPVKPDADEPVLEHMLYALVLENASYAEADKAYALLRQTFFDWNEVRVGTVSELAELLERLPDPVTSARHLRQLLQCVFQSRYSFDLEPLRKENLGKAIKVMEKMDGSRPFMISYVVQSALGGHAIPIDRGALEVMALLGAISPAERDAGSIPGLERTIAKSKGVEFGSLLHQLGADFVANPYSPTLHKTLLQINPHIKDGLPKRPRKPEKPARKATARTASKNGAAKRKARAKPAAKAKISGTARPKSTTKKTSSRISKRKPR